MEVVKVQLPLASNDPNPSALVYNIDRTVEATMEITDELVELMAGDAKAFFNAVVSAEGVWLEERVEDQRW